VPRGVPCGARRTAHLAFAVVGCVALIGSAAAGGPGEAPGLRERARRLAEAALQHRCLTPAIDGVFGQAIESGAFHAALGTTFRITGASSRDRRIDLTVAKIGAPAQTVTLAIERIAGRSPDGRAGDFVFYLQPGADVETSRVLLEIARVLAERIPDSALAPCRNRENAFSTRAVAVSSAGLAVLVVVVALVVGLWTLDHAAAVLLLIIIGFPFGAAPAGAQIIPPGEEQLLTTMLGGGVPLPDGCSLADGQIDRDVVRARYHCPNGDVRIHLSHPSTRGPHVIVTKQFALTVVDGSPHDELLAAIAALIRANESEFSWSMLELGRNSRGFAPVLGLPSWLLALLLLAMAAACSISAARDWTARMPVARGAALAALLVAATVVVWLQIKAAPPAHGDTAVDIALARDCIVSEHALCLGHAASAIGLVQGQVFTYALAVWLHCGWSMRALCFVAACVLGGATGLLHYAIARRFGGLAWVVSAFTAVLAVSMTGYPIIWNPSWFVLPLTVAFLATLATAAGSGPWSTFVSGVALAIATESHILFGAFIAVAALIVLLTAERPVVATAVLVGTFFLTELVLSPASSTLNAVVLQRWVGTHLVAATLVALLAAVCVPIQLRLRLAIRDHPERREAVVVLVWLLVGAVGIGLVLPWAVSRPPQIRYYGAAFPAIGFAGGWLLNAVTRRTRSPVVHALAIAIFAAIFAHRMQDADFARAGWSMDDGMEVAAANGLIDTSALDIMFLVRPLPDGALRDAAAAFAGTADAPRFPPRMVRAVRPQPGVALPDGWTRIRQAHGDIFTSAIDAWTHPEEAEVCPDPANGEPCMTLTHDDFQQVARDAGGALHRVFGLRIARGAARIGEWTRRGTRFLRWKIPLRPAGPDETREIVFRDGEDEQIVAVDGTAWTALAADHAIVHRPPLESAASLTVRTGVAGKFEAGVPPMPFELRQGEAGVLQGTAPAATGG
jgi:hypothetical protein